jgi:hypothetical protein
MSLRQSGHIHSVLFCIFILSVIVAFSGCRSLPGVELGECEKISYNEFAGNFQFDFGDILRYRYSLHCKDIDLICSGVTQKTSDNEVKIAGISDSGLTLYLAKWQGGRFEVLKNNMNMSDSFLKRSVLSDLLLPYRHFPAEADCIRRNTVDGSLWLKTQDNWHRGLGCFVLIDNQPGWSGLRENKIHFKAFTLTGNDKTPTSLTIENYKEGYSATIRYSKESFGN